MCSPLVLKIEQLHGNPHRESKLLELEHAAEGQQKEHNRSHRHDQSQK